MNLFAPFSVGFDKKNTVIKKSVAEAGSGIYQINRNVEKRTQNSITYNIDVYHRKTTVNHWAGYILTDIPGTQIELDYNSGTFTTPTSAQIIIPQTTIDLDDDSFGKILTLDTIPPGKTKPGETTYSEDGDDYKDRRYTLELNGLSAGKTYYLSFVLSNGDKSEDKRSTKLMDIPITTLAEGEVDTGPEASDATAGGDAMPNCSIIFPTNLLGCVAGIIYYTVFVPTSYVFMLAGQFFDYTFFYSVSDKNYRSGFVTEGWGLVRDFVNIFFIFVLLYIAFATILSLHGFKTKEMIINVVIIGLLINFSLFATQVIIDTSNILARVFYSSIKVNDTPKGTVNNDKKTNTPGSFGEVQLSAKIVEKVNPQALIMNSEKAKLQSGGQAASTNKSLSTGQFILIELLAIAINIIGLFIFISVGLIFIARVIGLWLAMVFVPFAFFSYTVPSMQDIPMLGWKKWWPETLKLAFLAPIFIFFLYLIIKFLDTAMIIDTTGAKDGPGFLLAIIVPFAIIMVLLQTAKRLAVDFSGKIGSAITKAAVVAGGVAVAGGGLAAGTAAALGRGLITNPLKMMQSSSATRNAALKNFDVLKPSTYGKAISARMANVTIKKDKDAAGNVIKDASGRSQRSGSNLLRDRLKDVKTRKADKAHAEHALDEQADKIQKGAKFSDLAEPEQKKAKEAVQREAISQTLFGKASNTLDNMQVSILGEVAKARDANGNFDRSRLDYYGGKLNKDTSKFHDADHTEKLYNKPDKDRIGKALTSVTGGSYDIRNLKGGGLTTLGLVAAFTGVAPIIGAALAAQTSGALRSGLKKFTKVDIGIGQKDFLKDLKNTLSETLKSIKIDVKTDHGGDHGHTEAKASGGHGGGGGHH